MTTKYTYFYPVDLWEYMDVLYLNNHSDGSGSLDIEVDISGCYDYIREEYDDEMVRKAAERTISEKYGENAVLVWKI